MGNAFCALSKGHRPVKGSLLWLEITASNSVFGTTDTVLFCVKMQVKWIKGRVELHVSFGALQSWGGKV